MYIDVKEFAKIKGCTTVFIYKQIKKNKIRARKEKGIWKVWIDDNDNEVKESEQPIVNTKHDTDEEYNLSLLKRTELENKLKEQKLRNLTEDTKLKSIRNKQTIESIKRQFAQQVFQVFTDCFSDVKNVFIQMKLDKEQNQKLKDSFKKAISNFRDQLLKKLENKEGDKTE